ncbi:hypothetical protein G6F58_013139 [Rhizopus delemar]|nr:hypothetical protein G6F58_013139 [Rhizopus delemar]
MAFQRDLVLGEGAGLGGAQHVHRAQVLDGIQPLDDDFTARHAQCALGERGRDDHRQHLGGQPHRDGQREEQRFQPVALGEPVDQHDDRRHDQHEADQHPADAVDALLELRGHAGGLARCPSR